MTTSKEVYSSLEMRNPKLLNGSPVELIVIASVGRPELAVPPVFAPLPMR